MWTDVSENVSPPSASSKIIRARIFNLEDWGDMSLQIVVHVQSVWRYISQNSNIHNHRCANLISYINSYLFVCRYNKLSFSVAF
jgi:hypothetical protein